jgi:hypothetical protein
VVDHVSRSIAWFRRIVALTQLPVDAEDVVPRERVYQTGLTSLQLAFEFGRAAASLAGRTPGSVERTPGSAGRTPSAAPGSGPEAGRSATAGHAGGASATSGSDPGAVGAQQDTENEPGSADQAAARISERVSSLQSQLSALGQQIAHAPAKDKPTLSAKRGELVAALDLAKEVQGTIGQIQRFEDSMEAHSSGGSGGLVAQIADLRKSVPELHASLASRGLAYSSDRSTARGSSSSTAGATSRDGASSGDGTSPAAASSGTSDGSTPSAPGTSPPATAPVPAAAVHTAELQRFIDFQTAMPAPEVYARLTVKGLECTVRYPVEPSQAVVTDQRMLAAVRQAQAKEPALEVVDGPLLDTSES